jgi:hypothetical protein
MTEDEKLDFGVALNEADLLGFEVDIRRRTAAATFNVHTLPEVGPPPKDRRVQIIFQPVGKVIASLRDGHWDDETAPVLPFEIEDFMDVVKSFDGHSVYGWEFIDLPNQDRCSWQNRLSLDWSAGKTGLSHTITLFQESLAGPSRHLDFKVWFDGMDFVDPKGTLLELKDFTQGGIRWWEGLRGDDPRIPESQQVYETEPLPLKL